MKNMNKKLKNLQTSEENFLRYEHCQKEEGFNSLSSWIVAALNSYMINRETWSKKNPAYKYTILSEPSAPMKITSIESTNKSPFHGNCRMS